MAKKNLHSFPFQIYRLVHSSTDPRRSPPMEASPPSAKSRKLRLMCSYGGQIVPRPNRKSLFYSGGETRIVSISATATLSSLVAHLSATLPVSAFFNIKYQLPGHDLDSLISLSTDDDLLIMLEEVQRLLPPSRIRLFLFPTKSADVETTQPESTQCQSVLCHPKTETWFVDALNSARMMQKGDSRAAGFGQNETLSGSGVVSAAESIVLETNSSFGSTSSSVSLTNLPSAKTQDDDAAGLNVLQENKTKSTSQDSVLRGTVQYSQTGMHHEQIVGVATTETGGSASNPAVPFSGFPVSMHYDQQQQQHQFVHPTYYAQRPYCLVQVPSTGQPMYQYQPQPQPLYHHHPNQSFPMYVLPSAPPQQQQYGLSMQCGLTDTRTVVNFASSGNPHVIPKVPTPFESTREASVMPCKQEEYGTAQTVPQGNVDLDCQWESSSPMNEFEDDDLVRVQIYKSQPALPTLPSQYQTMNIKTAAEALAQLHMDMPGN